MLEQQMKNCYSDLEKGLQHYSCRFSNDRSIDNVSIGFNHGDLELMEDHRDISVKLSGLHASVVTPNNQEK